MIKLGEIKSFKGLKVIKVVDLPPSTRIADIVSSSFLPFTKIEIKTER